MHGGVQETGYQARSAAKSNTLTGPTSGIAQGYLQANLLVLPSKYADDFRTLCNRNPVPCPLIAESLMKGSYSMIKSHLLQISNHKLLSKDVDLRRDAPRYMVYRDSTLEKSHCYDITSEWTEDHVAFLIGCSYSFETELARVGLPPQQMLQGRNIPMYKTRIPLCPAGVFTGGSYVVSMRPYKRKDLDTVQKVTRKYGATHGEPLAWGWEAISRLGIRDIDIPEWGDAPLTAENQPFGVSRGKAVGIVDEEEVIPVFWGCGVTPQEAVVQAHIRGVVMAHAPGHMLILDAKDEDVVG